MSSCLGGDHGECSAAEAGADSVQDQRCCVLSQAMLPAETRWGIHCRKLPFWAWNHFLLPVVWVRLGLLWVHLPTLGSTCAAALFYLGRSGCAAWTGNSMGGFKELPGWVSSPAECSAHPARQLPHIQGMSQFLDTPFSFLSHMSS